MKILIFMIGLSVIRILPKIKCELQLYKDNYESNEEKLVNSYSKTK